MKPKVFYILLIILLMCASACNKIAEKEVAYHHYQNRLPATRTDSILAASPAFTHHQTASMLHVQEISLPHINSFNGKSDGNRHPVSVQLKIRSPEHDDARPGSGDDFACRLKKLMPILLLEYRF